jgi:hypothetical protein
MSVKQKNLVPRWTPEDEVNLTARVQRALTLKPISRRTIHLTHDFPQIVVLCGSTRFVEDFNEWRKRLTHEGKIILSIEIVTTQQREEDPQHTNRPNKEMLDELHKRKIDLADTVMVLNVGGYIGDSTRSEIAYAQAHGKPIEYLEEPV